MMKLVLMRTATGMENSELLLLQRISPLELPASEIAAQIQCLAKVFGPLELCDLLPHFRLQT